MKLLRVGEVGHEKIAALDKNNVIRDLSDQIDGQTSEFILDPPVAYGTEYLFELYLDGQKLFRSMVPDVPDFYLNPNRVRVVLAPDFTLSSESVLIAKYVDQLQ